MKRHYLLQIILLVSLFISPCGISIHAAETVQKSIAVQHGAPISPDVSKQSQKEKISVTSHKVNTARGTIKYSATAGYLTIKDESDKPKAHLFFIAYEKRGAGDQTKRPITFAFNGGPGASSVFLHLGAIGPKRVLLPEDGIELPASVRLVDNDYTWLDFTDLVFIDPVGTGYSRPAQGIDAKQFYGVEEDTRMAGEFIRLYTTQHKRWLSPKFIAGESYGATRAAALAGYLQNNVNMNLIGLLLISPVLSFQTIRFVSGNDLPYSLIVPSYTASAWYHKKLPPALQSDQAKSIREAETWALHEYANALVRGDNLASLERNKIIDKLAYYTGISTNYINNSNLRVSQVHFAKELLRNERRTVGILDSRVKGIDADAAGEYTEFDPSLFLVTGPYAAAINNYIRTELKFETDTAYEVLNLKINREWNWGSAAQGFVNVADTLREAISRNKHLQVFIACGYYDLATPYFATQYTVKHLGLDAGLKKNISLHYYSAGHQMYTNLPSLKQLTKDVSGFINEVISDN